MKHIVVAVDLSGNSDPAIRVGLELAQRIGASVTLVHAWQLPIYAVPDSTLVLGPEVVQSLSNELAASLQKTLAAHATQGVKLDGKLLLGPPVETVLDAAKELGAGMVVCGTHGRTGLSRMMVGSVAERLVRLSPIPVLVVPTHAVRDPA